MTGDTKQEILHSALMKLKDSFTSSSQWSPEATDHEKTLVAGNLNGFCGFLAKVMPDEAVMSDGWQPIEAAPRDGTVVLAYNARGARTGHRHFFAFSDPAPEGQQWAGESGWREPGRDWPSYPTHWMPLPEPPVNQDAASKG